MAGVFIRSNTVFNISSVFRMTIMTIPEGGDRNGMDFEERNRGIQQPSHSRKYIFNYLHYHKSAKAQQVQS